MAACESPGAPFYKWFNCNLNDIHNKVWAEIIYPSQTSMAAPLKLVNG